MSKVKGKWRSFGLPEAIVRRVKAVLPYTGNQSLSEYARFAIQERLKFDEVLAEESREQEKEIQARLRD
ncbi:hypothetical protein ES705_27038 [subsurface metagenome]